MIYVYYINYNLIFYGLLGSILTNFNILIEHFSTLIEHFSTLIEHFSSDSNFLNWNN